jgi:hypothetical protein
MGKSLTLHAACQATLFLKGGVAKPYTVEEKISLWGTPAKVTDAILAFETFEERLAAYKGWVLLNNTPHEVVTWEADDPTVSLEFDKDLNQIIVGDTVQREVKTLGELHAQELDQTLARYEGWDFEWSWI